MDMINVLSHGIGEQKMLSKEEYVEKIVRDILNGEMKLENFVEEHFELVEKYEMLSNTYSMFCEDYLNPKSYKFEDLKAGMWVWCEKYDRCVQIVKTRIYEYDTGCFYKGQKLVRVYTNHDFGWDDIPFEENRFYPIHIAKRGVSDV